jgi:hypothetical protein
MVFKQNTEEYGKNVEALELSLLPKKIAATQSNGTLLANWLIKNCSTDGIVDASVTNMRRGISQLHEASLIDWIVPPSKKTNQLFQQERNTEIPNHARDRTPEIQSKIRVLDDISKARDTAEADAIISSAVSLARNVSRATHSKSYALRETLQSIIDASLKKTPNPTPAQAQAIFNLVQEKERATY